MFTQIAGALVSSVVVHVDRALSVQPVISKQESCVAQAAGIRVRNGHNCDSSDWGDEYG